MVYLKIRSWSSLIQWDYVAKISKKSWRVQGAFTKERFDIKHPIACFPRAPRSFPPPLLPKRLLRRLSIVHTGSHSELRDQTMCKAFVYKRLKTMENDKTISQKAVAVSCEMWSFTRGSDCTILTGKFLVFWICGRLYRAEKWSLTRGEHTWRFDCIQMFKYVVKPWDAIKRLARYLY